MSLQLNKENFETLVLQADKPVLVDFWGTGCAPCMQMSPKVDRLATSHADTAVVGKVNVVDEMDLAIEYGIRQIPVMMVFKDGKPVDKRVGAIPETELVALLETHIEQD